MKQLGSCDSRSIRQSIASANGIMFVRCSYSIINIKNIESPDNKIRGGYEI